MDVVVVVSVFVVVVVAFVVIVLVVLALRMEKVEYRNDHGEPIPVGLFLLLFRVS